MTAAVAFRPALPLPAPLMASHSFQGKLADLLAQFMAAYDILGRLHILQDAKRQTGAVMHFATTTKMALRFDDLVMGFESLPFSRALERIVNLTPMTRLAFDALSSQYRMQAFTIAGISDVSVIERIQKALEAVLAAGGTEQDFRDAVSQITSQAGIEAISDLQLNTVFMTSFATAYSNGRFEQMRDPDVVAALPYWKYWTVGDDRVRPAHAALDGFSAKWDDPVWRRIYPPSGYNCRCSVTAVEAKDASADADLPGTARIPAAAADVPDPGFGGLDL